MTGKKRVIYLLSILVLACLIFVNLSRIKAPLWKFLGVGSAYEFTCPADAVVVLGGGYFPAGQTTVDRLTGESMLRVYRGVQIFKECNAGWLVLSGRQDGGIKERQTELMRNLALQMGVPSGHIMLETNSVNTEEHSLFLRSTGSFDSGSKLAVVTSPWHLRRAMIEFKRYFPLAQPVASYYLSPELSNMLVVWLPKLRLLDNTTMLHEYFGIAWYKMMHWFPDLAEKFKCTVADKTAQRH